MGFSFSFLFFFFFDREASELGLFFFFFSKEFVLSFVIKFRAGRDRGKDVQIYYLLSME